MAIQGFGDIRQLGYVVADIDTAIAAWSEQLGVGPWTVIRNVTLRSVYRGEPSEPVIDVALSYRGDMQIELIQQKNQAPSPYRRMIENSAYGLHHSAFLCEDIDGDIARAQTRGLELVCDINMPDGARYAYLQSAELGDGVYIEFLQATLMMKIMFRRGIAAARKWQGGTEPVVLDMRDWRRLATSLGGAGRSWLRNRIPLHMKPKGQP